jgi:hypothetical protein
MKISYEMSGRVQHCCASVSCTENAALDSHQLFGSIFESIIEGISDELPKPTPTDEPRYQQILVKMTYTLIEAGKPSGQLRSQGTLEKSVFVDSTANWVPNLKVDLVEMLVFTPFETGESQLSIDFSYLVLPTD